MNNHNNIVPYNYHTHTVFCDGTATLEEMVLSAIKKDQQQFSFTVFHS